MLIPCDIPKNLINGLAKYILNTETYNTLFNNDNK